MNSDECGVHLQKSGTLKKIQKYSTIHSGRKVEESGEKLPEGLSFN
jgi:hypothetical protein